MNIINHIKNGSLAIIVLLAICSSCNKLSVDPLPANLPGNPAGNTLAQTLAATADDSLYNRLVIRSGILTATPATITDPNLRFTMIVPNNAAMRSFLTALTQGGIPAGSPDAVYSGFITSVNMPPAAALGIVSYNIIPQAVTTSSFATSNFPTAAPNFQYPTILNPLPSASPLLRLTTFLSKKSGLTWVNNVPVSAADAVASNGIIHHTAAVVTPPQVSLWGRISTDPDMTYFKAAIQRADSGSTAATSLQAGLDNIGANLTVFVPTDSAMRAALTGLIAQGLIAQGVPPATALSTAGALAATPAVFSNPALYSSITATTVKGLAVYHILNTRLFTVNFPTTPTAVPTLLNGVLATHPGVVLQATFTGPVVTAATAKGLTNTTASVVLINPVSTSDQNATNGVLHKINQVMQPQ